MGGGGLGRGREDSLEATYKCINSSHVRIRKHNTGRSEEKPCGASGIPAWGPFLYRNHDFLPLVIARQKSTKSTDDTEARRKREETEQKLPVV